jgi:hypothetical protein
MDTARSRIGHAYPRPGLTNSLFPLYVILLNLLLNKNTPLEYYFCKNEKIMQSMFKVFFFHLIFFFLALVS